MEEAMFTESLEAAASEKQEDGSGDKSSAMTWLQAAEHVLMEEGPEMHIRDLTNRIMELGMVNSSCTTSLETLLYRQTSKGNSKFVRVAGKMGCFGLRGMGKDLEKPTIVLPSERPLVPWKDNDDGGVDYEPKVFYKRKRKYSYRSSDSSSSYSSDDSDDEDEDDEEEDESSSELEGEEGEMVYRKRYNFLRKMAKSMIYVSEGECLADTLSILHYVSSPVLPSLGARPSKNRKGGSGKWGGMEVYTAEG